MEGVIAEPWDYGLSAEAEAAAAAAATSADEEGDLLAELDEVLDEALEHSLSSARAPARRGSKRRRAALPDDDFDGGASDVAAAGAGAGAGLDDDAAAEAAAAAAAAAAPADVAPDADVVGRSSSTGNGVVGGGGGSRSKRPRWPQTYRQRAPTMAEAAAMALERAKLTARNKELTWLLADIVWQGRSKYAGQRLPPLLEALPPMPPVMMAPGMLPAGMMLAGASLPMGGFGADPSAGGGLCGSMGGLAAMPPHLGGGAGLSSSCGGGAGVMQQMQPMGLGVPEMPFVGSAASFMPQLPLCAQQQQEQHHQHQQVSAMMAAAGAACWTTTAGSPFMAVCNTAVGVVVGGSSSGVGVGSESEDGFEQPTPPLPPLQEAPLHEAPQLTPPPQPEPPVVVMPSLLLQQQPQQQQSEAFSGDDSGDAYGSSGSEDEEQRQDLQLDEDDLPALEELQALQE